MILKSIVLKPDLTRPGSAGRPRIRPIQGRVKEKTEEGKTRRDPAGRPGDPVANSLTFFLFFY